MVIRKAFKFRISPNKEQQHKLAIQFGHARFVYNHFRALREKTFNETGKGLTFFQCTPLLTQLKKDPELEWLKQADSQVLQSKLEDLNRAYKNFFAGRAEYPNFKSKHKDQSIRYPQRFKIDNKKIYLPKVGWVKIKQHRQMQGKMKNATVSKTTSGKFFVSIQCELVIADPIQTGPAVGIDLGLTHFATLSLGNKIPNPRHLIKAEKRLKKLQRRLSRKKKGSKGRHKARLALARQHEKVANQRKDFLHKLSWGLVNKFGLIKMENLNVAGMMKNGNLAKSIADVGWGMFGQFLKYKGEWYGCVVEQIDRFFASSKLCHKCGHKNDALKIKDRVWTCPNCNSELDRDHNAAINILNFNAT